MDEVGKQRLRARFLITFGVAVWLIFGAAAAVYFTQQPPAPADGGAAMPTPDAGDDQAEAEEGAGAGSGGLSSFDAGRADLTTSLDEDAIVDIGRRILEGATEEEDPPAEEPRTRHGGGDRSAPPSESEDVTSDISALIPISAFFVSLFSSLTSFYFALSAHRRAERARAAAAA
ncbi:MAG: hypothetical protein MI723_19740 [Caulobacterales bacterium]|nr:hypothetical protein [Caulobacterales bacterium]